MPNARHHPPRRTAELRQVSRMKAPLFAVGCMPLLDCALAVQYTFPPEQALRNSLLTSPAPSAPFYGLFLLLGFALTVFVASLFVLSGVLLVGSLTDFLLCFELASSARRELFLPTFAVVAFVLPP